MRTLIIALSLFCSAVHANDATHCIELGELKEKDSRTLKNTCRSEVMVFWCHHGNSKGTRDAACNADKKFFRQQSLLVPGQVKSNRFSLPAGTELTYAACFGTWGSFTLLDGEGRYYCNPQRLPATGKDKKLLHTYRGDNVDEACAAATGAAQDYGVTSECVCESWGKGSICRVESTGKGLVTDQTGLERLNAKIRKELREATKCNPEKDKDCLPARNHRGGIGIRG